MPRDFGGEIQKEIREITAYAVPYGSGSTEPMQYKDDRLAGKEKFRKQRVRRPTDKEAQLVRKRNLSC
jgi:hypothetical protein